jgi:hypothetical protein
MRANALDLVIHKWEELSLKMGDCVTKFNKCFSHQHFKMDLHRPVPAEMLADSDGYMIDNGKQGGYHDLVCSIVMGDRTPTIEQCMEHHATLDTSLNMFQPKSGPTINKTTKSSARKMDSKRGGTSSTGCAAIDDCLIYYICGQVDHISGYCPNHHLVKKLLKHAMVGKDTP